MGALCGVGVGGNVCVWYSMRSECGVCVCVCAQTVSNNVM